MRIVVSVSFLTITIMGNIIIWGASYIFYSLEKNINNSIKSFEDAIWWGYSTASTVGYGDVVPITTEGKIVGILLMFLGIGIFAGYTAYFAQAVIEDEEHFFRKYIVHVPPEKIRKELMDLHFLIDKVLQNFEESDEDESNT